MGYRWKNKKCVPQLSLCGKWLMEMGFRIGDGVNVHVLNQQIIIHNVKKRTNG
jgi:antitoxin component of MazEF toxin-antitoxin module